MGKLIYCMNVSLDGYVNTADVNTPGGGTDWTLVDDELHKWFNERFRSLEASLYGRRLYALMSAHWPTAENNPAATETEREFARIWNATPRIVFSSSLDRVEHNSRLVSGDAGDVLAELRREFAGDLEVAGPTLAGQFVRRGLIDEYQLVVHPVVLGAGTPFWPQLDSPIRLRPVDQHTFSSGVELRSYVPA
jgi:dihydrofolate reductase